jgi:hypothetical protein
MNTDATSLQSSQPIFLELMTITVSKMAMSSPVSSTNATPPREMVTPDLIDPIYFLC